MKTSIYSQHEEHGTWLKKLLFYKDEIRIMQKQLEEVNSRNTGLELKKSVEHFQNQFIIQDKNSDEIRRHINHEEKELLCGIKANPVAADHRKVIDHATERTMVDGFESNFNLLRK